MPKTLSRFGLPLLAKELIEQSARKRTYVVRVLYAALVLYLSLLFMEDQFRISGANPRALLGNGRFLFHFMMFVQLAGVCLFMPAITCATITGEKDRNSLQLLFLTRLGPWTILFEKLMSRLVPMLGMLLAALPLLAFAYALGGVEIELLLAGVWMMTLTTLQTGLLALACSAWFRTTARAFVASYLLLFALYLGPRVALLAIFGQPSAWGAGRTGQLLILGEFLDVQAIANLACPPLLFTDFGSGKVPRILGLFLLSLPSLLSCGLFLGVARWSLVRRAALPPGYRLVKLLKAIARFFTRLNENRITRGRVLIRQEYSLPENRPVAWRETAKRSFGRPNYLLRLFVILEAGVGLVCLSLAYLAGHDRELSFASATLYLLWIVAALIVSVHAVSLIAGERTHQTLDVLCTTPISGIEILRQKYASVQRVMLVLLIPFLTLFAFEAWWKSSMHFGLSRWTWSGYSSHEFSTPVYLICSILSVGVYLPLLAWLAMLIGLKVKSQTRATIGVMSVIIGWCALPYVLIVIPLSIIFRAPVTMSNSGSFRHFLNLISPATIVALNEDLSHGWLGQNPWEIVIVNFLAYSLLLVVLRGVCLNKADRLLGRLEAPR
jgi:ABC-type transport system involved in multi-copper enzyme maturation permease subunit